MKKNKEYSILQQKFLDALSTNEAFIHHMFFMKLDIKTFISLMKNLEYFPISKLVLPNMNISDNSLIFIPNISEILSEKEFLNLNKGKFPISDIPHFIPSIFNHVNFTYKYCTHITEEEFYTLLNFNITDSAFNESDLLEKQNNLITHLCSIYNNTNVKINELFLARDQEHELPIFTFISGFIGHDNIQIPDDISELVISYLYQEMHVNIIF